MKRLSCTPTIIIICLHLFFSCSNDSDPQMELETPKLEEIKLPVGFDYVFAKKPTVGKEIYTPIELINNDFNSNESQWSYMRSASSDNVIVFWEKGFGQYPNKVSRTNLRVNINELLKKAEQYYTYYSETMKFVIPGSSQTDDYRMIIQLYFQEEWLATGSGYDNKIGALWINPTTTNVGAVIAHEIGHSFQYQVACDGNYGFRDQPYVGTFWEQCAQFMSWQQNNTDYITEIPYLLINIHKNFSHEDIRYQSMYLQEFWKEKHGVDFLGKLWRNAISPEHPIEAYKRITGITQEQLNDEIFQYARKNISWEYPLGIYNREFIKQLPLIEQKKYKHSTFLEPIANGYYQISTGQTLQSYGYNAIELSVPGISTVVSADFEGLDGGNSEIEGWRYGFVAIKDDNTSVFGTVEKTKQGTASFIIPEGIKELWLVVTGAPIKHNNHIWDEDSSNDQEFPYKIKFSNTTIL